MDIWGNDPTKDLSENPKVQKARKPLAVEVSRRIDASKALARRELYQALVNRSKITIRNNLLNTKGYLIDWLDEVDFLFLWSKNSGKIAEFLTMNDFALLKAWPVVYCVITMNGWFPGIEGGLTREVGDFEQYLQGLRDLVGLLGVESVYLKVGDPFFSWKEGGIIRNSWDPEYGTRRILEEAKNLGFSKVHCGAFDDRKKWARIHKKSPTSFVSYDWENMDQNPGLQWFKQQCDSLGLELVSCAIPGLPKGKCVDPEQINRINPDFQLPLGGPTSSKSGVRDCGCPKDILDLGINTVRGAGNQRGCFDCDYCFVGTGQDTDRVLDIEDLKRPLEP